MKATIILIPAMFGTTIVFKGQYMFLVLSLFIVLFFLDVIDIFLRVRLERMRDNFQSNKLRAGLDQRAQSYVTLLFFVTLLYFIVGAVCGTATTCGVVCVTISGVAAMFILLYIINVLGSIVENNIDTAIYRGIKPQAPTLVLAKVLGILYKKIEDKLLKEANDKNK